MTGDFLEGTVHLKLNRGQVKHPDNGKLSAHGLHAVFLNPEETSSYVYEEKDIDSHKQAIYDEVEDSFREWLYQNASHYLPWTTNSYEEFRKKVSLGDDELIGAVFCAENYEAAGH